MRYIAGGIVLTAVVIGVIIWLRGAPERKRVIEPTTPPDITAPKEAPKSGTTTLEQPQKPAPITKPIKKTTMNGMTIEVTKEGAGPAITNGQHATMLYTGKLDDGTVFDASSKHNNVPFEFTLGAGEVIKGWDQGVLGMKVGEERTLTIPSDLAYGPNGIPGVIPGGATLTFDVTLVSIK